MDYSRIDPLISISGEKIDLGGNYIAPGFIDSPMNGHLSEEIRQGFADETPLGRLGQVDDLVPAALFLLSDQASWITGQVISVDGGIVMGS